VLRLLGIGAQKCGTTWLYEWLGRHPELNFPAGKEVHFWDQYRLRGLAWYRGLFAGPGFEGDITPAYAILPPPAIAEIHAGFPDLRLVYALRNPIERAWSQAMMELERAAPPPADREAWLLAHFRSAASLQRGDHETCIRNWRAVYGDALMLVAFEDIVDEPREVLRACARHIGIAPAFYDGVPETQLRRRVFAGAAPALPTAFRAGLAELYGDRIAALGDYLGRDLSHWIAPV